MSKFTYLSVGIFLYILFTMTLVTTGNYLYGYFSGYDSVVMGQGVQSPQQLQKYLDEQVKSYGDYKVMSGVYTGDLNESVSDMFFLEWPVKGNDAIVTQCFNEEHPAIDIADYRAPKILAAADGVVILADCLAENCPEDGEEADYNEGLAHTVMIEHDNGYITVYGHLREIFVVEGEQVIQGDQIGQMGNSGKVDIISDKGEGVHLHFALLEDSNWSYLNPARFLTTKICEDGKPGIETTFGTEEKDPDPVLIDVINTADKDPVEDDQDDNGAEQELDPGGDVNNDTDNQIEEPGVDDDPGNIE